MSINRSDTRPQSSDPSLSSLWNILQAYGEGVLSENSERRLVLVNAAFCEMFNIPAPPTALRGIDCAAAAEQSKSLFADEEGFLARIDELIRERKSVMGEQLLLKDGRVFERDYIPIVHRGVSSGQVWIYHDATDRVRSQEMLRDEHVLRGAVLESALDAVIVINESGEIVEFNPAAEHMFGYTRKDVIGSLMTEKIMPHRYRSMHTQGMRRYLATGEGPVLGTRIEIEAMRQSGEVFPIELAIKPIRSRSGQLFTAFIRDITSIKQSDRLLKDQRSAAIAVAEATSWLVENKDTVGTVNTAVKHVAQALRADRAHVFHHVAFDSGVVGVIPDYMWDSIIGDVELGTAATHVRPWDSGFQRWLSEFESNRSIIGRTLDLPPAEASPLLEQGIKSMAIVPVHVDGALWGTIGFDDREEERVWSETEVGILMTLANNIGSAIKRERLTQALVRSEESLRLRVDELRSKSAELEQATATLIAQDRMATLGTIASSVAHEINSPLGAILNSAERAVREGVTSPTQQQNLDLIIRASMRTKDVIERLLSSTRRSTESQPTCNVDVVIDDCMDLYGRQIEHQGAQIVRVARELPNVNIGHSELLQILTNLLYNARDAVLSAPDLDAPSITITTEASDDMITINVRDNGPGLTPEVLARAFEPFYSTKEAGKGTGLGLWISQRIARSCGGDLTIVSHENGATAVVTLPVAAHMEVKYV